MSKFTAAEMLRRDNFRKRWDDGDPVFLHEFLYALMQGYDAYALDCDVQVGGTEQLFNLMAGRKIQEEAGQRPHVPVTLPILVGLDGKERMSKSKGNHIGVSDTPSEQYGKAMSIPDDAVMDFFVLATNVPRAELDLLRHQLAAAPMDTKKRLARTIVTEFWGESAAGEAEAQFERTVQRKETPGEIAEFAVSPGAQLLDLIVAAGLAASRREARRLFDQGAVSLNGVVLDDPSQLATPGSVLQVGKRRWLRLT
jgi:tyrosyl-tRNA synthetase